MYVPIANIEGKWYTWKELSQEYTHTTATDPESEEFTDVELFKHTFHTFKIATTMGHLPAVPTTAS